MPGAPGSVFRDCDGCPEMVVVPAGAFVMGTPAAVRARGVAAAEADAVVIALPRAFALGRTEVTRAQYSRFIAASGYEPRTGCRTWEPALGRFNEYCAARLAGSGDAGGACRRASRFLRVLCRCTGLRAVACTRDRRALSPAVRGGMGIRSACGFDDTAPLG